MTAHVPDEAVVDLAQGAGAADERAHAAACPDCARRVDDARSALELARRAEVPEPQPDYWRALRRGVSERIAEEARPASRFGFLVPLAAAAAVVMAVLSAPPQRPSQAVVEPRLSAWSALPAEAEDEGLLVLEGLALTSAGFAEWERGAGLADYLAGLTDDESRVLAETLRQGGQGGES